MTFDSEMLTGLIVNIAAIIGVAVRWERKFAPVVKTIIEQPAVQEAVASVQAAVTAPDDATRKKDIENAALKALQALGFVGLTLTYENKSQVAQAVARFVPDVNPEEIEAALGAIASDVLAMKSA